MRVLIVGGVAGGASCAARLRRIDESAEIVIFERGEFVSFANCGLPYYVGGVIAEEKKLLVASPELFRSRFRIDVRTGHEVRAIDRAASEIEVVRVADGAVMREKYDALVLAPGAAPVRPPLPGIDGPGIFSLRTIPDSRAIREWMEAHNPKRAVVVGAGFIGLEMAENLAHRGLSVTVLEADKQVMPPLDPEIAIYVEDHLRAKGVNVMTGDAVAGFDGLTVKTRSGAALAADMVVLAIGVRPDSAVAREAGLAMSPAGGIVVDDAMRTSDERIWAVGDAVAGAWNPAPLAGPANRQGRIAADAICGRAARFRGIQATAVCGCMGLTVASTGVSEKRLKAAGDTDYECIYLHPAHHVGYYPGARPIHMKLIYRRPDGLLLGAQAVGEEGVERRIDVLAMALQKQATVFDLEEAELCYAPQYGAAKDAVNQAGMIAANVLRGDVELARWSEVEGSAAFFLDVRDPHEFAAGAIPGAVNIPLPQLRGRLAELPKDREIWVNCGVGQRSYYAVRILAQHGYRVKNLPGGYQTYKAFSRTR